MTDPQLPPPPAGSRPGTAPPAAGPVPARPGRSFWIRSLKIGGLALVLYFVIRAMARQLADVPWSDLHIRPSFFVLALMVHCLACFLTAVVNRLTLDGFGPAPGVVSMCIVCWVSNLGKYLPGKVAAVASTIWLLNRFRVPARIAFTAVAVQQALAILTGFMVSAPLFLWHPIRVQFPHAGIYCLVILAGGTAALHPRLLGAMANTAIRLLGRPPLDRLPSWRHYLRPVFVQVLSWAIQGVMTWLTASAIVPVSPALLPVFTAATAMGASLGVLALVPGGIGVREGVMLVILSPLTGSFTAIIVVVVRLLQLIAEVLLAGTGAVLLRRLRTRASNDGSDPIGA